MVEEETKTSKNLRQLVTIIILLAIIFAIGTFGYMILQNLSFLDAFIKTVETVSFGINPEHGPIRIFQVFLLLFGVFIVWWALWWLLDLIFEGTLSETLKEMRFIKMLRKMENHYIICGGGRIGEYVADMLREKKIKYVIIEKHANIVEELKRKGHTVVLGDATDEKTLIDEGIKKAKAVIAVLPESERNILITLTAHELRPDITIYARAHRKDLVNRLKQAGATYIILPEIAGAEKIAKQILG